MSIIVKQLSYAHSNGHTLFQDINFSIQKNQKVSLIGNNGSGKSTILRIISGQIQALSGEIICDGYIYYIPQHFGQYNNLSIAEVLNIDKKIDALYSILAGNVSEEALTHLSDDWGIEEKVAEAFSFWDIAHVKLSQTMSELSGGEKTKVFLAGIIIHTPSIIIMDEPSNHLDKSSRNHLYKFIEQAKTAMLIVSHDRNLLNLLPLTYELNNGNITIYGGNYDFYKTQKDSKEKALENKIIEKEKALRIAKKTARETAERKQKLDSRSEKSVGKKGLPRIALKTLKNQAESSSSRLKDVHSEKITSIATQLGQVRQDLSNKKELKLNFENSKLHSGKTLVSAQNINFEYSPNNRLWKHPLTFEIRSGDRIIINGNNGSGKTTLLKLIFGQLEPCSGKIDRSDFSFVYIDQDYSLIDNSLTVLEQIQKFNKRNLPEHDLKVILNRFLFPAETWNKQSIDLSGGEKMRLVFSCLMTQNNMPDLFVMDEPTNNLDIASLEVVSSTIKNYVGTLLLISHDTYFVDEVRVETSINIITSC